MSENLITFATANTHESRMLKHPDGLEPFVEKNTDVILLQEVLGIKSSDLENRLSDSGFRLVGYDTDLGLAIAVSNDSNIEVVQGKTDSTLIHKTTATEKALRLFQNTHRLRERGMLGVGLIEPTGHEFMAVTTHPIVFIRAISRYKQIKALGQALNYPVYKNERVVIGGDMNHYPSPRAVDISFQQEAGLSRVLLDRSTWCIEGSRHEWMARIGSLVTGKAMADFDAELDTILYRGLTAVDSSVIDIESDHRAIVARLKI